MTLLFTLDTSCVIAIVDDEATHPQDEIDALAWLIDTARSDEIHLQLTESFSRDLARANPSRKQARLDFLLEAPVIPLKAPIGFRLGASALGGPDVLVSDPHGGLDENLRRVLGPDRLRAGTLDDLSPNKLRRKMSDVDHLLGHSMSDAAAFVTLDDKTILRHAPALEALGVLVRWPSQARTLCLAPPDA
jgi:hypothetical protein